MRIGTRLFLGTAAVVLTLLAVQWWLQIRQLRALQRDLADVAVTVGESFVFSSAPLRVHPREFVGVAAVPPPPRGPGKAGAESGGAGSPEPHGHEVVPEPPAVVWLARSEGVAESHSRHQTVLARRIFEPRIVVEKTSEASVDGEQIETTLKVAMPPQRAPAVGGGTAAQASSHLSLSRIELKVEGDPSRGDTVLVVSGTPGGERRIPLPESATEGLIRRTLRDGVAASGALLLVGLLAAAIVSHRVTRPLRDLAEGVESVGEGRLGTTVAVTARGEIGDLQRRFNTMSGHLASLEQEKEAWRAREHLAQLGQLARGLGHTLRNPLNTLGLVVEELAERTGDDGQRLADTARGQIRRIDRWLVSFLALGAGRAPEPQTVDLREVIRAVVLESARENRHMEIDLPDEPLSVTAVPEAVKAALANLVENAVDASPQGGNVAVSARREGDTVVVSVRDHGSGLPEEVRDRLFSPHVTTKVGGSGMGLFLARQLLESGHQGRLELDDAPGGGTLAKVTLTLAPTPTHCSSEPDGGTDAT